MKKSILVTRTRFRALRRGEARPFSFIGLLTVLLSPALVASAADREPSVVFESPNAESDGQFGQGVVAVPDVNGDDKPDILVSAWYEDPGSSPSNAGRVYLFDGVTRQLLRELKSPGEVGNGNFGGAVGIDDINGDGRGDVIVSTGSAETRVYVFSGATGALIHRIATRGRGLSAVSDVSGDGRPDFITSDWVVGTVNIYNGASGARLRTLRSPNPESGEPGGLFGSISGIPDVNGDGRGDVVVGAVFENLPQSSERPIAVADAGRAYVFDGTTGMLLHTLIAPEAKAKGHFGRSVAGLADVNGDGRGDVAVGANGMEGAFIFDGATGALLHTINNPNPDQPIGFGWVVNSLPDVNGDGRGDVVVAGFPTFGTFDNAYVFSGSTGKLLATLPGHSDTGGGRTVAGLPDVNGDGNGEVLVAAPFSESTAGVFRAGQVLLYLSEATPRPPQPSALGWSSAEGFKLRLTGEVGVKFELQRSDDLINWSPIATQTHTGGAAEFLDVEAKNTSRRFYRTRTVP